MREGERLAKLGTTNGSIGLFVEQVVGLIAEAEQIAIYEQEGAACLTAGVEIRRGSGSDTFVVPDRDSRDQGMALFDTEDLDFTSNQDVPLIVGCARGGEPGLSVGLSGELHKQVAVQRQLRGLNETGLRAEPGRTMSLY